SCNAEPPMIAIAVRPGRASHDLIVRSGEFVVNIPTVELDFIADYVGTTTVRDVDKWAETGLTPQPAAIVAPPLLAECPVNVECRVSQHIVLPSHSLFIASVLAIHADPAVLNTRGEVDYAAASGGLPYRASAVRERPVDNFRPEHLRERVYAWRDGKR
ncbi:MAG: flavin reductase family protein, partial [Anaerolineae bacterium]|nr:flavin reductase family protein [Anaerolineae bacterium]